MTITGSGPARHTGSRRLPTSHGLESDLIQTQADRVDAELKKRRWETKSPRLRAQFWDAREDDRRTAARKGSWIGILVYVLFSGLDAVVLPDVAAYTIGARAGYSLLMLAIIEWQFRNDVGADAIDATCAFNIVGAFLVWLIPASFTDDAAAIAYYKVFGTLFMMSANLFFLFRTVVAITTCASILAAFACTVVIDNNEGATYTSIFGVFYLSCFLFSFYINVKLDDERYRVFLSIVRANLLQQETKAHSQTLLKLSYTDALTDVHNRRSIDVKLREFWSAWQTDGRSFAAILIDVDFFKKFNDWHGHQQGDQCLITVANALKVVAERHGGLIGRYGGEEFIILVPATSGSDAELLGDVARITVETIRMAHEMRQDGVSIVTVSVGVSFTRSDSSANLERIVHEADRALYVAKANGRNCVRLYDRDDPQINDVNDTVAALLKIAIERNLVSLVYQPIEGVVSGKVEAFETLMRLKSLDGTSVSPAVFIPAAERTGVIVTLGRWAILTVCRDVLAPGIVPIVSVNVSAVQLKTPGFAASVAGILMETAVPGHRLALEITEGLEIDMDPAVLCCIADLKRLGVQIWLDDFGTGFAGLSWLRLIAFDTVKIDKSFLHNIADPTGRSMLQDIITLVRNRGPKILVEGVETREQLDFARSAGLDHVQGYHVGRPAPLALPTPHAGSGLLACA